MSLCNVVIIVTFLNQAGVEHVSHIPVEVEGGNAAYVSGMLTQDFSVLDEMLKPKKITGIEVIDVKPQDCQALVVE